MEELYLKTENGMIPIEQKLIEKYNLKAGTISPNNRYQIVDKNGNVEKETKKEFLQDFHSLDEMLSDGIMFTQAEKIDIIQGVDSE